jgi:PAT family beta-lactamase induction signal transducer AmpG
VSALARAHRLAAVLVLGFASGLPLALTGGAMQAWLTIEGVDLATIGFLALVGVPYTFKFLWAPLVDRFDLPWLGRRRGWLVASQVALSLVLFSMAGAEPATHTAAFAGLALFVAFLSASQDIVIDAYRTDLLLPAERGLGSSLAVFGYRAAMVLSGGISLIWAQQWGDWGEVYRVMAVVMAGCAVLSLLALPSVQPVPQGNAGPSVRAGRELLGFASMIAGVALGYGLATSVLALLGFDRDSSDPWVRLLFLSAQIAAALWLALWAARRVGFDTLTKSLDTYFSRPMAWSFLALIVLYKVGDAFAMSLATPFLIRGMGFEQVEVGVANKTIGLAMTIAGAMLGGLVLLRVRLASALIAFGVLQLVSNLGYYVLAVAGRGAWGAVTLPAFDAYIVSLAEPSTVDTLLLAVVGLDNISGGMGTAALVALLMALCTRRYSATHYALLSAFAVLGRVFIGPFTGVLAEQVGWPVFFLLSLLVAAPGVLLVVRMRKAIASVERPADGPDNDGDACRPATASTG